MADSAKDKPNYNVAITGRKEEREILDHLLITPQSEFVAMIGRRRVGKTFLIKNHYHQFDFECTALHNGSLAEQLQNFHFKLIQYGGGKFAKTIPANWLQAFQQLQLLLKSKRGNRKKIVFIDELPWMDTAKANFTDALAHFWNDFAVHNNVLLVICGSAASWIIKKIVHNKGGLHNRITQLIILQPFTLKETEQFLNSKKIIYSRYDIALLYMVMGGIPFYLNELKKGLSAVQNLDKLCFTQNGLLKDEFNKLFSSLFTNAGNHILLVKALATKRRGLTRIEILKITKLSDGGNITRLLEELQSAGFIQTILPFGKTKKESLFRLTDAYSLFYLQFIEKHSKSTRSVLQSLYPTSVWKAWSGYAFENLCLLHIQKVLQKLGVGAIYTEVSGYISKGNADQDGIQIDLLIDRADRVINLCEIKFNDAPFLLTKDYAAKLRLRIAQFRTLTATRKNLFLTMITPFGLIENRHSSGLVQNQIILDDLF